MYSSLLYIFFFFSSRRRHTRSLRDWSSDVCSSDLSNLYFFGVSFINAPQIILRNVSLKPLEIFIPQLFDYITGTRSEERRVGKECRSRLERDHQKKNTEDRGDGAQVVRQAKRQSTS